MSNSIEQHVELTISIRGRRQVAFVTDMGWAGSNKIALDMISIEDAVGTASGFIAGLQIVPFENCCSNEAFVEEARAEVKEILDALDAVGTFRGTRELTFTGAMKVSIKFEETYAVNFGE